MEIEINKSNESRRTEKKTEFRIRLFQRYLIWNGSSLFTFRRIAIMSSDPFIRSSWEILSSAKDIGLTRNNICPLHYLFTLHYTWVVVGCLITAQFHLSKLARDSTKNRYDRERMWKKSGKKCCDVLEGIRFSYVCEVYVIYSEMVGLFWYLKRFYTIESRKVYIWFIIS